MSRRLQQREHVEVDFNYTKFRFIVLYLLCFELTIQSPIFILFVFLGVLPGRSCDCCIGGPEKFECGS